MCSEKGNQFQWYTAISYLDVPSEIIFFEFTLPVGGVLQGVRGNGIVQFYSRTCQEGRCGLNYVGPNPKPLFLRRTEFG